MSEKLAAGSAVPEISLPQVGGGTLRIGGQREKWQVVIVYRGKHCPICKRYLGRLKELMPQFAEAGIDVATISGDPEEKATAFAGEIGANFPVGYGLPVEAMRRLGLYVSQPRSAQETDRPFAEPGLFVINPHGQAQMIDVSNAPFARPELQGVLDGVKFVREKGYPVRGTG